MKASYKKASNITVENMKVMEHTFRIAIALHSLKLINFFKSHDLDINFASEIHYKGKNYLRIAKYCL